MWGVGTASVVVNRLFTQSERFEDPRKPCGAVLADLRKRTYSVLLHECSEGGLVKEYVATHPSCFNTMSWVSTIPVDGEL